MFPTKLLEYCGAVMGALLLGAVLAGPAAAEPAGEEGAPGSAEGEGGSVGEEARDLARALERAMREQGEYIGRRLEGIEDRSRSWLRDRFLQARVKMTLSGALGLATLGGIDVDVQDGEVTLAGEVADWGQAARAVRAVRQIEGITRVISRLTVAGGGDAV